MSIEHLYTLFTTNYLVDTDTRHIRKGSLFFALKGANFDGNRYAMDALKKGAAYAVVDDEYYSRHEAVILVRNVLETLQELAQYHRRQLNIPVLSLTGSNGKTTTKELINAVLSKKYKTLATRGNLNNHIGVPLTLLSITKEIEFAVIEMGANHHKEIELLSNISEPDYGYITNFGKAHLEGFGSVQGVIEAKSELYDYLISHGKTVFVNQNDAIQVERTKRHERVFFDERIAFVGLNPYIQLSYKNKFIQSQLIGKYNFDNIAVAITVGAYFGVDDTAICEAITAYAPDNNRSQILKKGSNDIIMDAYNANPTSMKAAIDNFKALKSDHKVLILGDMFELGHDSVLEHQKIADTILENENIQTFLIGDNFFKTNTCHKKFKNYADFQSYMLGIPFSNSLIMIKGSRGMALERLVAHIN